MGERAFHDSRDRDYRAPYGAVQPGTPVTLAVDVWDAPDARVTLRTWVDGVGEARQAMRPAGPGRDGAARYEAELAPEAPGVVWYHFIVEEADGRTWRYGARDGCYGGIGAVCEWEPPSFALAVCGAAESAGILDGIFGNADAMRRAPMALVVSYLRGELPASQVAEALETLRETCSPEVFRRAFDLLATYSQARLFALLAGAPDDGAPDASLPDYHADPAKGGLAKGRLWCACLVQTLALRELPAPAGAGRARPAADAGAHGAAQAEAPLHEDRDCEDIVRNAAELHDALPAFRQGSVRFFCVGDDVLGFWRCGGDGTAACVLLNASLQRAYDVPLQMAAESVSDVLGGYAVPVAADPATGERRAMVHLYQLGSAVVYFHPERRLQRPLEPGLGVLAHITSLPAAQAGAQGTAPASAEAAAPAAAPAPAVAAHPGTLGVPARAFVDWLARAGVRYWQVLPVNPTDEHGSPYAGISAFAGNVRLLEGGMAAVDDPALPGPDSPEYRAFCEREAAWLEPYACFMAIRQRRGPKETWQQWPKKYLRYDPRVVARDQKLSAFAETWRRLQFAFDWQWKQLRAYANGRGVRIVGDMPLYVSADSADVWAHREVFQLEPDGQPAVVAGCPPDQFAVEGQVWGNPVYDWDACRESGYAWWLRRLRRAFDLYDEVRVDHFIGFSRYFSIPAGQKATAGEYRPGPGLDFFRAAQAQFGPLPIIAEDLGYITPCVRALVAACGFPGMDVVQFVDGNDPLSGYRPRPEKVAYTGTHDNQTLVGYVQARYPHLDAEKTAAELADRVASCGAEVCVLPLQDVLGLDDAARMNTPGTTEGNWAWQAKREDVEAAAPRLAELVARHAASVREGQE